jgi:surface polysaccharide O-acyltransferase-like enzyme
MNASEKDRGQDAVKRHRIHFLDNLRTFTVFLVIVLHAGGVYEASGVWASFWIVDDPATNNMSGLLVLVLDVFVMATVFFISGYLAPASLKSRSAWLFVRTKFTRLLLPWIVAALTLLPLYKAIFLYSRGLPQEHWTTYFHWSNGIWSQNWLWFLPVLFSFNILYLLFSRLRIRVPNVSLKQGLFAAFVAGFGYSVGMDSLGLHGWTQTALLDFQNDRLLIYFVAFLVGALCFRQRAFMAKPGGKMLFIIVNALAWVPVTAYIVFLLYPWLKPGRYVVSETVHRLILWFCFQLSLFCLVYLMVETFRRYLYRQGQLSRELSRNSYYVYIIHVTVMGGIAVIMLDTAIHSLLKHVVLAASTFVASNLIVSLCRRVLAMSPGRTGEPRMVYGQEGVTA